MPDLIKLTPQTIIKELAPQSKCDSLWQENTTLLEMHVTFRGNNRFGISLKVYSCRNPNTDADQWFQWVEAPHYDGFQIWTSRQLGYSKTPSSPGSDNIQFIRYLLWNKGTLFFPSVNKL